MSPLSRQEIWPVRLHRWADIPALPKIVRGCLMDGIQTAPQIKEKTGLSLEKVYEGLVWLEGHGKAVVIVSDSHGKGRSVEWGAL